MLFDMFYRIAGAIQSFVEMLIKYHPFLLQGIVNTIFLSLLGTLIGFALGMVIALARVNHSRNWILSFFRFLAVSYVEIIRGTPLLVQLLLVHSLFPRELRYFAGVVALSLNSAAYVSEIIRAGIQSVDKGQMEAARSLGLSVFTTYKEIIIPQAVKNILPALGNEFIVLIKETSIISMVGIMDVMYSVSIVQSKTYQPMPPLVAAMLIYLLLTMTLSRGLKGIERRLQSGNER